MSNHLKLFENHAQYEQYISGDGVMLPNVSHCINESEMHYTPYVSYPSIVLEITVPNDNTLVWFYRNFDYATSGDDTNIKYIEINGVRKAMTERLILSQTSYGAFYGIRMKAGNYTVKYILEDETFMSHAICGNPYQDGGGIFIDDITNSITVPETVTSLNANALSWFGNCQININIFNLEFIDSHAFSCLSEDGFTNEEKSHITSVCPSGYPYDMSPCK